MIEKSFLRVKIILFEQDFTQKKNKSSALYKKEKLACAPGLHQRRNAP
jgi:hypothetical protein